MAITLSVVQSGGKLNVYADNSAGDHVAIVDHIILSVYWPSGSEWHRWFYQDDFYFGDGRVPTGWMGLMVRKDYSSGAAKVQATADYWEVDETTKSPKVDVT